MQATTDTRNGNDIHPFTFHCHDDEGNQWKETHYGTSWETAARVMIRKWKRYQKRARFFYQS